MVVIFGTPGLSEIFDVYHVLDQKIDNSPKPIYPVMPSITTAKAEMDEFISKGKVFFPDEVTLATALTKIYNTPEPMLDSTNLPIIDTEGIRDVINNNRDGYLLPDEVGKLLDLAGIPRAVERVVSTETELTNAAKQTGFPLVMKVVGPVHKSDVGGVVLNVDSIEQANQEFCA